MPAHRKEQQQNVAENPPLCPQCHEQMTLARVLPKFLSAPELRSFLCTQCGRIETRRTRT
jgi:hypothetical protein